GEGSDEILAGYVHFRRDFLLYQGSGQVDGDIAAKLGELEKANPVSHGLLLPDGEAGPLDRVRKVLGFVPSWIETFSARTQKLRRLLPAFFLARYGARESFSPLLADLDIAGQVAGREPVHQSLYLWAKTTLPNYVLTMLGDRMEMAHSVEGRVPFLDHHVVEVIQAQPVAMKIRGLTEKFALREAARDVITDTVYKRQKHPF